MTDATQVQTTTKNWIEIDDEQASAGYVKFQSGDKKILQIVSNPIAGNIEFKQPDGSTKVNFGLKIEVMEEGNPEIKIWTVTSKSVRDQLKAICKHEGLGPYIAGSTLRVMANGDGLKRTYFVEMIKRPVASSKVLSAPTVSPVPADPGQVWIEQQRAAAVAAEKAGGR
jgi:hypothetical protein